MGKIKNEQQKVFDECYAVYEMNGYGAVIDHVAEQQEKCNADYMEVVFERCEACDNDMPSLNHICLVCSQNTTKPYFEIVSQGYNKELFREEIQIHCGENANLFLIKTDEGFIVDVYNQTEHIDTIAIWEEDLMSEEDNENM